MMAMGIKANESKCTQLDPTLSQQIADEIIKTTLKHTLTSSGI